MSILRIRVAFYATFIQSRVGEVQARTLGKVKSSTLNIREGAGRSQAHQESAPLPLSTLTCRAMSLWRFMYKTVSRSATRLMLSAQCFDVSMQMRQLFELFDQSV